MIGDLFPQVVEPACGQWFIQFHGMLEVLCKHARGQFLHRLRRIFEPDPSSPRHFLTIRDAGYRFIASP